MTCRFFLGSHIPSWLGHAGVPLFVSRRTMHKRRTFPRAVSEWALDSGGFSELSEKGYWGVTPQQYAIEAKRFQVEIGRMEWAAIQDWMCEPFILKKTGKSVEEHQRQTVFSYLTLEEIDATIPWTPVLQGWTREDYLRHIEMYLDHGIDLADFDVVGLGSVCRRQGTKMVEDLIREISEDYGICLHGFGLKLDGLKNASRHLRSADSMAWSRNARWEKPLPGHTHLNCANCLEYALIWRHKILAAIDQT